ncbi:hypothetical protein ZEAMMB73_Zm00001d013903, partial [Zea mays]
MGEEDAYAGSDSSEEGEEDAVEREAALEKDGYMEDIEDKPVVMESDPDPDPDVHGAPMYESARAPAVQDLVAEYDQPAWTPAVREVEGDGVSPRVRLGDVGGPVVEDPAAPRSKTPAAREGEDIGTTPVVQQFETMSLSDGPAHVGAAKEGAKAEEWEGNAADMVGGVAGGASYTDRLKNAAAGTTEYGRKLASTVYEKVAGAGTGTGTAVGVGKRDDERTEAVPASNTRTDAARGAGYTDNIKSAAAGTTGYGKQLASTVYDKVAGVGTAVAPSRRQQEGSAKAEGAHSEAMPVSDTGGLYGQDQVRGCRHNGVRQAAGEHRVREGRQRRHSRGGQGSAGHAVGRHGDARGRRAAGHGCRRHGHPRRRRAGQGGDRHGVHRREAPAGRRGPRAERGDLRRRAAAQGRRRGHGSAARAGARPGRRVAHRREPGLRDRTANHSHRYVGTLA